MSAGTKSGRRKRLNTAEPVCYRDAELVNAQACSSL